MDNITVIRNFMVDNSLKYLLVNATNEFLVEYNTLEENSRYKLTKCSGSVGEALVTPETIYLFVDGRYHIQSDQEVDHEKITVVKLHQNQKFLDELFLRIPEQETLGVFSKKVSQKKYESLAEKRQVKLLDSDPLDASIDVNVSENISLPIELTGLKTEEKISKLSNNLSWNEALYITDLDEVSYLFNMRNFSQVYSAKIKAKALIFKDNTVLFTQDKLNVLEEFLRSLDKKVFVDKSTITAFDYSILSDKSVELKENAVQKMKSQKTTVEIEHLKDAFRRTDNAVFAIRKFIDENENLSEFDIAVQLAKEFKNQGA